uniref:Uncharacterized protein n=1 Tax=viral metagenome TaxID=1070528 RepID=A0A6M3KX51_9ZZZZ
MGLKLTVDMKALKREIAKLNKTGILEENVDASGETKDIVEKFCDAVETALEKDGETLKKSRSIVETYNDLVDQLDKMSNEVVDETPPATPVKKATKKVKAKKEKETLATAGKKKAEKNEKAPKKEEAIKEKAPKKEKVVKEKVVKEKVPANSEKGVREMKGTLSWDKLNKTEKKYISFIICVLKKGDKISPKSLMSWALLDKAKKEELLKKYKEKGFAIPKELK